jgi:hypothetical protein
VSRWPTTELSWQQDLLRPWGLGADPAYSHRPGLLVIVLGGLLLGAASFKARANTTQARASAQIVATEPVIDVLSFLPAEVSSAGLLIVRVGQPSVGVVMIRITPSAPMAAKAAEKAGDLGATAEVSAEQATQNMSEGDGTLQGDLSVAVSVPAPSSGALVAQGQSPLNMTVEFN